MNKKIIKAWGRHYVANKQKIDDEGWYDRRSDLSKKQFDGIELETRLKYCRPISLSKDYIAPSKKSTKPPTEITKEK